MIHIERQKISKVVLESLDLSVQRLMTIEDPREFLAGSPQAKDMKLWTGLYWRVFSIVFILF